MSDSFIQHGYWFMFVQVIVTLLVLPALNVSRLRNVISDYIGTYYPNSKQEVHEYLARKLPLIKILIGLCFLFALIAVAHAFYTAEELFHWDNQAGLIVLFFVAFFPIFSLTLVQKGIFKIFKKHAGSTRSASMQPVNWKKFFPVSLLVLLLIGQALFAITVSYFVAHPFEGFAGYSNLSGLLFLNIIFTAVCYVILTNSKMASVKDFAQREAIKSKAIRVTLVIWIVATFNLSASLCLAGFELREYALLMQSFYIQIILFLTAYSLAPAQLINGRSEV